MEADDILVKLGSTWSSPWNNVNLHVVSSIQGILCAWAMLGYVYISGSRDSHHCHLTKGQAFDNATTPLVNGQLSRCTRFSPPKVIDRSNLEVNVSRSIVPCDRGYDHLESGSYGIIQEWDLVCDKDYYAEFSQSVLVFGVLVGAGTMAYLSDKLGRKSVFLTNAALMSGSLALTALVDHYNLFLVMRFFTGVFQQGTMLSGYVISCEMYPVHRRTLAATIYMSYWPLGMVSLACLAYYVRNWRRLLLWTSTPALLVIPSLWLLSETLPWLLARNKLQQADEVVKRAAKWNGVDVPSKWKEVLKENRSGQIDQNTSAVHNNKQYNFLDILKSKQLRNFTLIFMFMWMTTCLVYYGLSLSSINLNANKYVNFGLSGVIELPAYLVITLLMNRYGRRIPICVFLICSGVSMFLTLLPESIEWMDAKVVFSMVGKFFISAACIGVFMFTPECYPTTVRNIGLGMGSFGGRIGNMLSPYTVYAEKVSFWFPTTVFGVISVTSGLLILLLPETSNAILPTTIDQIGCEMKDTKKERNVNNQEL